MSKRPSDELRNKDYEPFHITEEGLNRLREKLARLKHALPDRIEETRRTAAYGDRSENDEYKTAKATLRRTNWQILNIENQIKRAVIIKFGSGASGTIQIGSTVVLEVNGAKKIFQILGPHETDPAKGRISYQSPLGAALLNHSKGDTLVIQTGGGSRTYRILEIQ
ncbi:MAG: hypothetical protein A2939_04415 [Parcubacteria group bacterium RIFCSPLOWO2_01_FULL_48_18]|nr:MAG: hypothetical protein A3J67_03705 [Parcubacteria group bacterium RIFCSPHIGHO2_02_FULL_48_10b]OHB22640.1 MAG: hypothetical protein A2939_04415 [Parcubacteria group bacterium RIFCSPLOWO2_01_FULL_48_18]